MLIPGSRAHVCDNSGAQIVRCIKVLKGSSASIGETILVVVERAAPNSKTPSRERSTCCSLPQKRI